MALAVPFLLLVSVLCTQAPAPEPVTDQETELGLAVYDELKAKAEIVGPYFGSPCPAQTKCKRDAAVPMSASGDMTRAGIAA
jgi:hypothetical protein